VNRVPEPAGSHGRLCRSRRRTSPGWRAVRSHTCNAWPPVRPCGRVVPRSSICTTGAPASSAVQRYPEVRASGNCSSTEALRSSAIVVPFAVSVTVFKLFPAHWRSYFDLFNSTFRSALFRVQTVCCVEVAYSQAKQAQPFCVPRYFTGSLQVAIESEQESGGGTNAMDSTLPAPDSTSPDMFGCVTSRAAISPGGTSIFAGAEHWGCTGVISAHRRAMIGTAHVLRFIERSSPPLFVFFAWIR